MVQAFPTGRPGAKLPMHTLLEDLRSHQRRFILWPGGWRGLRLRGLAKWTKVTYDRKSRSKVPAASGVYLWILKLRAGDMEAFSHLLYVGESKDLRQRFTDYLGPERDYDNRPWIADCLARYESYLEFWFAPSPRARRLRVEDAVIQAYLPPLNMKIRGRLGKAVKALNT